MKNECQNVIVTYKMFSRQFSNQQLQCNLHKHVIVMDKAHCAGAQLISYIVCCWRQALR